jgi:hypothetical protein
MSLEVGDMADVPDGPRVMIRRVVNFGDHFGAAFL